MKKELVQPEQQQNLLQSAIKKQLWTNDSSFKKSLASGKEKGFTDMNDFRAKKLAYIRSLPKRTVSSGVSERKSSKYSTLSLINGLKWPVIGLLAIAFVVYAAQHRFFIPKGRYSFSDNPASLATVKPATSPVSITAPRPIVTPVPLGRPEQVIDLRSAQQKGNTAATFVMSLSGAMAVVLFALFIGRLIIRRLRGKGVRVAPIQLEDSYGGDIE